jgi:putative membrane protein
MPQNPVENEEKTAAPPSKHETWKEAWMASPGPVTYLDHVILFLKGMCMGTADIVPGVSGGTVAFITGIYHSLLTAISSFNWRTFLQALRFRGKEALSELHLRFIVTLATGIALAVVSTAHLMHYLLTEHAVQTWSLFFGLITASIIVVSHSIKNRISSFPTLILGTVLAYGITSIIPLHTPEEPWFIFFCGVVAICAMILPGLSGSFILLVLGKYAFITSALRNPFMLENTQILLIFLAGCVTGILGFSRILRYGMIRWHDFTLAFLTGLMIGAMRKVWPWKIALESQIIRGKEYVIREENVWPLMDVDLLIAMLLMSAGFLLVLVLEKFFGRSSVN